MSAREAHFFMAKNRGRYGNVSEGMSHRAIAEVLNVSPVRVQQIEAKAIAKVKRYFRRLGIEAEYENLFGPVSGNPHRR